MEDPLDLRGCIPLLQCPHLARRGCQKLSLGCRELYQRMAQECSGAWMRSGPEPLPHLKARDEP